MLKLGKTAKIVRDRAGLTQREAADMLGISVVHLSNIENNKSGVSDDLIASYKAFWNVDLYILAWCLAGDVDSLPPTIRGPAKRLMLAWRQQFDIEKIGVKC